jgi:large subunit ribosomal protein L25
MDTYTLLCEKRDLASKAKKIRKNGLVPAVIYGRHINSLSLQIKQPLVVKLIQNQTVGSKVLIDIDGEEHLAIIKELQRDPVTQKILHIDFQELTRGEKVKVALPINYINRDSIEQGAILQEQMSEIEISTLPEHLIDYIDIDISKYSLGDSVFVNELDIYSNEDYEVISSPESLVFSIIHVPKFEEATSADEEEADVADEEAETTEE